MPQNISPEKARETVWMKGAPSAYQLRDLTHFPDWRSLIVLDAWFNNLASSLMICAGLAWGFGGPALAGLLPFALTIALAVLIVDLGILVADLGDPARFIHSLRVMRLTSPLSVGVWGLTCLGIFLGIAAVFSWALFGLAGQEPSLPFYICETILRLSAVMAIVAAVVVICYKPVVFSCSSQPGLKNARWLPPFMVADSLLMGLSLFAMLALAFSPGPETAFRLILPLIVLLVARCATFALLWQDVKTRAREINRPDKNRLIAGIVYGIAGILPFLLFFCGAFCLALACLILLLAGLFERNWLIGLARPKQ